MDHHHILFNKLDINFILNPDFNDSELGYLNSEGSLNASTSISSSKTVCGDNTYRSDTSSAHYDFRNSPVSIWKDPFLLDRPGLPPLNGLGILLEEDNDIKIFPFSPVHHKPMSGHRSRSSYLSMNSMDDTSSSGTTTRCRQRCEYALAHQNELSVTAVSDSICCRMNELFGSKSSDESMFPCHGDQANTRSRFRSPRLSPAILADSNIYHQPAREETVAVRPDELIWAQDASSPSPGHLVDPAVNMDSETNESGLDISASRSKLDVEDMNTILDDPLQTLTPKQLTQVVEYVFEHIHAQNALEDIRREIDTQILGDNVCAPQMTTNNGSEQRSAGLLTPTSQANLAACIASQTLRKTAKSKTPRILQFTRMYLDMCRFSAPVDITVMDPHLGISELQVAQKTVYWKANHPGETLSDAFLFTFAGKLEVTGIPIPGYRCYILGCDKMTKRKDHMADHIRTHIGEKPFTCSVCGLCFIRNNDCQRHEANHLPVKKFICECGAAFSRRDLFVRHRKTACTLLSKPGKRRDGSRRQRRKALAPGPYECGTTYGLWSEQGLLNSEICDENSHL